MMLKINVLKNAQKKKMEIESDDDWGRKRKSRNHGRHRRRRKKVDLAHPVPARNQINKKRKSETDLSKDHL